MFGVILALALSAALAVIMRALATRNILWVMIPANCYGIATTKGNRTGDITEGGGGVTNIVHNIPGRKLVKSSHDLFEWYFERCRESRGIIFLLLGIEWIGPFRTLRTNKIRRFRYGKRRGDRGEPESQEGDPFKDYFLMDDDLVTEYVPFSGEQAISVTGAESNSVFRLNFLLNAIEEANYPLRSIRVADANAIQAGMVKQRVNSITGSSDPEVFLKPGRESTETLINTALLAVPEAEEEVGRRIVRLNLVITDMSKEDRELYELEEKSRREGDAKVITAERTRRERVLLAEAKEREELIPVNVAEARYNKVLKPAADDPVVAGLVEASIYGDAYKGNTTVTDFGPTVVSASLTGSPTPSSIQPELLEEMIKVGVALGRIDQVIDR